MLSATSINDLVNSFSNTSMSSLVVSVGCSLDCQREILLSIIFHFFLFSLTLRSGASWTLVRTGRWSLPESPRMAVSVICIRLLEHSVRSNVEELNGGLAHIYVFKPGDVANAMLGVSKM